MLILGDLLDPKISNLIRQTHSFKTLDLLLQKILQIVATETESRAGAILILDRYQEHLEFRAIFGGSSNVKNYLENIFRQIVLVK